MIIKKGGCYAAFFYFTETVSPAFSHTICFYFFISYLGLAENVENPYQD